MAPCTLPSHLLLCRPQSTLLFAPTRLVIGTLVYCVFQLLHTRSSLIFCRDAIMMTS